MVVQSVDLIGLQEEFLLQPIGGQMVLLKLDLNPAGLVQHLLGQHLDLVVPITLLSSKPLHISAIDQSFIIN